MSAVIPLKPNHLHEKFTQLLLKKAANMTGVFYSNHPVRMLTLWCSEMCPKPGPIPCCPSHAAAQGPALSSSRLSKEQAPLRMLLAS